MADRLPWPCPYSILPQRLRATAGYLAPVSAGPCDTAAASEKI
jgi:hypothetical protein